MPSWECGVGFLEASGKWLVLEAVFAGTVVHMPPEAACPCGQKHTPLAGSLRSLCEKTPDVGTGIHGDM